MDEKMTLCMSCMHNEVCAIRDTMDDDDERALSFCYHRKEFADRWISVEERLPEDDLPLDTDRVSIKVLTVTKHGKRRFVRELTRQRWEWRGVMQPWSWSKDARGVTHWMPMPEPPKEVVGNA